MAAQFHADARLDDRELRLTGILNTVPFHLRETLTFQLPVVLPLLGTRLAVIYIAAFWLTGVLKLCYVLICGRTWGNGNVPVETGEDPFSAYECSPDDPECLNRSLTRLLKAGGLLMIPVTRLRRTLPRYIAIYGGRNGTVICGLTMAFGLLSRILILAWILLFY
ncbi:hypothetical protein [Desulfobacter sp.]|uniref:hypothetical protein n=1 Tax=Desulfobacter sp. TaxID=2294 RepID=UPI003D0A7750